jgi:hypothetical protein
MSPRAAARLEQLGFRRVYDYAGGKTDWIAAALPFEGDRTDLTTGDALVRETPTCGIDDPLESALAQVRADAPFCVVVDGDGIVLGLLRPDARGETVADAMEPGPTTVRASKPLAPLREELGQEDGSFALVTDPDGRLLGTVGPA